MSLYSVTKDQDPSPFHVRVASPEGKFTTNEFVGFAHLHESGALIVLRPGEPDITYGPGMWHTITLGPRPKATTPVVGRVR